VKTQGLWFLMSNSQNTIPIQSLPLQGQELNRFIQQWLVSLTGIDPNLMRPVWQTEPPNIPSEGDAWGAFRVTSTTSDTFPAFIHHGENDGTDELQRHEILEYLVSFYDLGTNGFADAYAATLRDGMAVAQNREILTNNSMNLLAIGNLQTVPSLLKQRWLYRVDLSFQLARAVTRTYEILNVLEADVTIKTDEGYTKPFIITQ